jgi:uncharacterized repeat protein (TIGR01451 family)
VRVPNGTGVANYTDFASPHRAGDLSGINVDPTDGSFWAANEFANTQAIANWGTAVANFAPSTPANSADVAVTASGPSSVTAGTNAVYTITLTNHGPNPATGVVLSNSLPAGSTFVSMTQSSGSDPFVLSQSSASLPGTASMASGSTDTFTLTVSAASNLAPGANFSETASVSSTTTDPNSANNSSTVTGSIAGASADLAVTNTGQQTSVNEGDQITYTVTVTDNDTANSGTGVVLTDTLGANLNYVSATTSQGSFTVSGGVVTFSLGTIGHGATATMTITAQATEDPSVTNSASVSATSADPNNSNNSASANTTVNETPIAVSGSIHPSRRSLSSFTVATFTHANGVEPTSAFTATISWGDGQASAGTISLSGTTYTVKGTHTYSRRVNLGNTSITTTVNEISAAAQLLLAKVGDEVPDMPPHHGGNGNGGGNSGGGDQSNEVAAIVADYLAQSANGRKKAGTI